MNTRTIHRAIVAALAVSLVAAAGLPGPARAATRYNFAVGAGSQARFWQSSQWNPGTCTIDVDHAYTKMAAQWNAIDSVVVSPAELGILGRLGVPVSWGAAQQPPTGAKLQMRFVFHGTACPRQDFTFTASSFAINVPANVRFIVFSAAEGAVQPWVAI